MKTVSGIVLAGGKSSRYKEKKHKFLTEYQGKPLIVKIIEAIQPVVNKIVVVVGPYHNETKKVLGKFDGIEYVIQEIPLGTGHALLTTSRIFENSDYTLLVTYADKPLITTSTFSNLVDQHIKNHADITIATAILPNPGSKGRVVRIDGKFAGVVEAKDADEKILQIKEVNAGFIVCESNSIYQELRKIKNNNAAGEYYLTDVYEEYLKDGLKIHTVEIPPEESCDINTYEELKKIEEWIKVVKNSNRL
ncbi:MAG TPA: NTP transferase domain-containing protein [bacterium]|nr:NTP transferase domain-containing protein [bacterium]HOL34288.1 NTP transferase domain-containing protein [bacterium]HPP07656.1 NTP transferase domain-containing protein [bacterium]